MFFRVDVWKDGGEAVPKHGACSGGWGCSGRGKMFGRMMGRMFWNKRGCLGGCSGTRGMCGRMMGRMFWDRDQVGRTMGRMFWNKGDVWEDDGKDVVEQGGLEG